jgi:hypothetical protein
MTDQLKQAKRIRRLNDKLRRELPHGSVVISREVGRQFSNDQLQAITELIRRYDVFGPDADLDDWHDTGVVEFEGVHLVWEIEFRLFRDDGPSLVEQAGAETERWLRILLAEEGRTQTLVGAT